MSDKTGTRNKRRVKTWRISCDRFYMTYNCGLLYFVLCRGEAYGIEEKDGEAGKIKEKKKRITRRRVYSFMRSCARA